MSANQPLAQLKALKMEIRAKTLIITAVVSLTVLPLKAVENPTASELSDKKRPSAWNLLRKHRQKQTELINPQSKERIVHFPDDGSIGRAFIVEPQFEQKPLYHYVLGWPNQIIRQVRGDVNVPAGKILRLDVWDSGPKVHAALAGLGPDDVQILNFYQCKGADDRMLAAASRLTGLKVVFLGQGRFTHRGLEHLAGFKDLRALQLPNNVPTESLRYLKGLTSLDYLNISGPELTLAKMARVGQLPWLTQLSIAGHGASGGLKHIANLRSLRYLNLAAVRDPDLDLNLAHIADLTDLEEIDFEDSMIGDAGLAHLRKMKKLKKIDLFSNPDTGRITDKGIAHLTNLTALEDLRLPSQALTDLGMVHLAKLDSVRKLNLWSRHLTDKGIAVAAQMKSLQDLDVSCSGLTDVGLAALCRCSSLKSLSIGSCKVTDAGLLNVANLKSLEYFAVGSLPVKGNGLAVLKQCPSLRELSLSGLELNDQAITHVAAISSLERLRLYYIGTEITDESLNQLSTLTALKKLSIVMKDASQMPITDAGIEHLSHLKNLQFVWLNHCEKVTDEGLAHLEGLSSLRELRLDGSRVTNAGAERLKQKIPGVSVTVPTTMRSTSLTTPRRRQDRPQPPKVRRTPLRRRC